MSLKLAISITGDASSLKGAVAETEAAINRLGQVTTAADAKVEASAEAATTATKETAVAIEAVGAKAGAAAGNVVQLAAGMTKAEREARAAAIAVNTAGSAVERFSRSILDQRLGVATDFGGAKRGADIAAYGAAMDDLRAKYNPLFAAGRTYKAQLDEIRQAESVGALSKAEATAALDRTKTAFASQVVAMNRHTAGMKLNGMQATQLSYQLNDVFVSLAGGQNPLMVAIQQGSQITPIFGGMRGTLVALAGVINPVTVGIAAITGAVVASGLAWNDYRSSTKEVQSALIGIGHASGATVDSLKEIASEAADTAGVSIRAARSMEVAFLRTGKIGQGKFQGLIEVAKPLSRALGTDVPGAADVLARAMADPERGALQLNEQLGFLDGRTNELIRTLVRAGDRVGAQRVLIEAVRASTKEASDATSAWASAWDTLGIAASNAWDSLGKGFNSALTGAPAGSIDQQIAAMKEQRDRLAAIGSSTGELDRLIAQKSLKRELDAQAGARQAQALKAKEQSRAASDTLARLDVTGTGARRQELQNGLGTLTAVTQNPAALSNLNNVQQGQLASGAEAYSRALATLQTETEKKIALDRIDLQLQAARDPITKAQLAAEREQIELGGQVITSVEAKTRVQQAYKQVLAAELVNADSQTRSLDEEATARKSVLDQVAAGTIGLTEAERILQLELQLRPLVVGAMKLEGEARASLLKRVEELGAAYAAQAEQQKRTAALQQISGQNDQIERLKTEIGLTGQSAAARSRVLALLEAEQHIRSTGIGGTAEAQQIRTNAVAQADLTTALERQQAAWQAIHDTAGSAIDGIVDALGSGELSADSFTGILKDLGKELATLSIGNPLKNALLGDNLPTITDVIGRLTGKAPVDGGIASAIASTVGSMTVSAGTVIVNGGVAGTGLGGLLGGANDNAGGLGTRAAGIGSDAVAGKIAGLNDNFEQKLSNMIAGAKSAGFDIKVNSGFRSVERQQQLWDQALEKYGSADIARKWVAPPGRSMHNFGMAADLGYGSDGARSWAQQNAGRYGLNYPLANENWHVEPIGARSGGIDGMASQAGRSLQNMAQSADATAKATTGLGSGLGDLATSAQSAAGGLGRLIQGIPGFGGLGAVFGGGYTSSTGWLYDVGGYTGPGGVKQPAGIVHRGEVVWSQDDIRRAGGVHVVEGMRRGLAGYASGGAVAVNVEPSRLAIVQTAAAMPAARAAATSSGGGANGFDRIVVHNNLGVESQANSSVKIASTGERILELQLDAANAGQLATPGSKQSRALTGTYGAKIRTSRR